MIAYKLVRQMKDGTLAPLFINRTQRMPLNQWLPAEDHKTKGYAHRPGWHCTNSPEAPHLSNKGRVWCKVEIEDFTTLNRPAHQGGTWYLANEMKILNVIE